MGAWLPRVFALLTRLLREPLERSRARGRRRGGSEARLAQLLGELTGACALALLAVVVGVAVGLFVVQGPAFASSSRTHGVVFRRAVAQPHGERALVCRLAADHGARAGSVLLRARELSTGQLAAATRPALAARGQGSSAR